MDGQTDPFEAMIVRIGKLFHTLHVFLLSHKSDGVAVFVCTTPSTSPLPPHFLEKVDKKLIFFNDFAHGDGGNVWQTFNFKEAS